MGLVRDQLASCAVGGGRLVANFTLQGHRQVVNTSCPGEALYNEIRGWEHFGVCGYIINARAYSEKSGITSVVYSKCVYCLGMPNTDMLRQ